MANEKFDEETEELLSDIGFTDRSEDYSSEESKMILFLRSVNQIVEALNSVEASVDKQAESNDRLSNKIIKLDYILAIATALLATIAFEQALAQGKLMGLIGILVVLSIIFVMLGRVVGVDWKR